MGLVVFFAILVAIAGAIWGWVAAKIDNLVAMPILALITILDAAYRLYVVARGPLNDLPFYSMNSLNVEVLIAFACAALVPMGIIYFKVSKLRLWRARTGT